jgi:DNA invertase Pin-like site-specific DNA recombinase
VGKALLDMLGLFAEFETNLRCKRQMEGAKADKARGIQEPQAYYQAGGGPPVFQGGSRRHGDCEKARRWPGERVANTIGW